MCSGVLVQAVDAIKKEGLALEELREKATKSCTDKRIALRKLENQALERKNRRDSAECQNSLPCLRRAINSKAIYVMGHTLQHTSADQGKVLYTPLSRVRCKHQVSGSTCNLH